MAEGRCACCGELLGLESLFGPRSYCSRCRSGHCTVCRLPPIESRAPAAIQAKAPLDQKACPTCGKTWTAEEREYAQDVEELR